ncbi:hypothetical protein N0V93_004526 [Gnomoniopsis smithogilvyi]|uniref:Uncharacterized protein n=1 Tax=Gnomoniopsis smithogilvyi TaxID=1191159 RepID=A0A9W8YUV8_9PEZI|nr:hypothetical protein N0V93_004526 [Gnomoniopsis smithogilvyi]
MSDIVNRPGLNHGLSKAITIGRQAAGTEERVLGPGLLGKVPAEIRIMIYEEVFVGSEMALLSTPRDPKTYQLGGRSSAFFSSGHHHILLTCRLFYNEAHTIYWRSTKIVNGDSSHRFSLRYLVSHLPEVSKPHIQYLIGLDFSQCYNRTLINPQLFHVWCCSTEDRQLLGQLPGLKGKISETAETGDEADNPAMNS